MVRAVALWGAVEARGSGMDCARPVNTLTLEHVSHDFGALRAVDGVSLVVEPGELVCLVGPSGCGKSTLLRIAAGLEPLQAGRVLIGDAVMADATRAVPPEDRGVGLVFQDYALFPHLSVIDNVAFGLAHLPIRQRRAEALAALAKVGMTDQANAFTHELSGGQQQRTALARAMAPRPRVMLLDEPFSGLDARLRARIRDDALHILKGAAAAALMVTHDPEEAMFMADRIAVMRNGVIEQTGAPSAIYFEPANAFVAEFFGDVNRLAGTVVGEHVPTPLGQIPAAGHADGAKVEVLIRPEALRLSPDGAAAGPTGIVEAARLLGRTSLVHLTLNGNDGPLHLHARVPGRYLPADQTIVGLRLETAQAFVFPWPGTT